MNKNNYRNYAIKYLLPNSLTALSFLFGMGAITLCYSPDLNLAAWLIVWSVLLDIVDGVIARALKATSKFGAEFDSLADLTAFGIAPAILIIRLSEVSAGNHQQPAFKMATIAAALFFALMAAIRLARFNVAINSSSARWFSGFPSTLSGAVCALSVIVTLEHGVPRTNGIFVVLLLTLGIGMVLPLRIPKLRRRANPWVNRFQTGNLLAVYGLGLSRVWPEYLLGIAVLYLVAGTISGLSAREDTGENY